MAAVHVQYKSEEGTFLEIPNIIRPHYQFLLQSTKKVKDHFMNNSNKCRTSQEDWEFKLSYQNSSDVEQPSVAQGAPQEKFLKEQQSSTLRSAGDHQDGGKCYEEESPVSVVPQGEHTAQENTNTVVSSPASNEQEADNLDEQDCPEKLGKDFCQMQITSGRFYQLFLKEFLSVLQI